MELTAVNDRGEIEIAIINDMFGFAEHLQDKEMQEAVKVYFGGNYDYAKSIYDEFKTHGHAEIERHFIDDNTFARINSMSIEVLKEYDKYKEKIEYEVNRLFGIGLPNRLKLVTILIQKSKVPFGGSYLHDMGVITLRILNDVDLEKEMPIIIDVLIHEILHAAFDNSGIKNRLSPAQKEALDRCFAPHGILSLFVGLIKDLDFDELYKNVSMTIYNSDDLAEFTKLFPYIKDYYAQLSYGKQNVLDYLADKINVNKA